MALVKSMQTLNDNGVAVTSPLLHTYYPRAQVVYGL